MKRERPHYRGTGPQPTRTFFVRGQKEDGKPLFLAFAASTNKRGDIVPHKYHQWFPKTYKTLKGALENNKTYARGVHTAAGLALYYRPEDLEPVNITADERIAFYKEQVDKWMARVLESGLSSEEVAVYCEAQFLKWGELMKERLRTGFLYANDEVP